MAEKFESHNNEAMSRGLVILELWDIQNIIDWLKSWEIRTEEFWRWYAQKKWAEKLGYTMWLKLANTINKLKAWDLSSATAIKVMLQSVI